MRKFKVDDRVLIQFTSGTGSKSKVWNGVVVGFSNLEHDYLIEVEGNINRLDEEWLELDIQYHREERLKQILDNDNESN